jgi:hypothetical protein
VGDRRLNPAPLQALKTHDPRSDFSGRVGGRLLRFSPEGSVVARERLSAEPASGEDPFVGRVRELQELCDAYADARARRRGGVHLILGDPGVGKTRLASALCEHAAADGATVVWTRGWGRAAPAYWPWVEVVRGLCHDVDGDTLRRELGAGADELLRLAPELAERLPGAQQPADHGEDVSEIARFTLFDALVTLLRTRSAHAPIVVLIDDLQAVDEGSLVALDFVSRMLRDLAVLLVVTMHERVPERSPDGQTALSNIVRAGRRLVLGGLSSDDVGRLIALSSGIEPAPALALAVHARTEGNAFFTREILALLVAEGRLTDPPDELPLPDGVRDTIRRRLAPLGDDAVATLELAAIFGRTFRLPALERASALDRDVVLAALEQAAALGIVVELPGAVGHYRFGHGLIGETLLSDMSLGARMAAHEAAGAALEDVYRGALDAHLPELAHHFLQGAPRGDVYRAVDYAQRAAQRALDSLAYEQAADLFARALDALEVQEVDVPRRASLLLGLGTAQSRAGRPAARATFDATIAAARAIGAHDIFARAALGAAPFALTPGFVDEAHVALLVESLERIDPGDDPLRVRLMGSLARALYWSDAAPRRAALARDALRMARRLGDPATLAFALSSAQLATSGPNATEQGLQWLVELFALTERSGESLLSLDARSRHVDVLLELDDLAGADIAIEALERLARETRDPHAAAFAPLQRARRAAIDGRFEDARALLAGVAAVSGELSATTVPMSVASSLSVLNWVQRGPATIGEDVRAYADGVPAMPVWRAALAASLACSGRSAEARLEFDRLAAGDFAALPRDSLWFGAIAALTETVAALSLPASALELYAQLAPYAGRNVITPTVAFLGPVDMWLGILARVGGRHDAALEHLARARTSATRNGARMSLPRIAAFEAEVLIELGGADLRARAEVLLAQAAAGCEAIGYRSVLDHIARLRERLAEHEPAQLAPTSPLLAPPPPGPGDATMRRVGDVWTIDDGRTRLHLNDGRGMRLLALLLERPGLEIHSLELAAIVDGAAAPPPRAGLEGDGEAGDRDVAAARPERSGSAPDAERARVNVTRALRSTVKRIAGYDERLGRELDSSIRTGTYCVYEPDPRRPLRWTVESAPR